jgi:hypothetical protein
VKLFLLFIICSFIGGIVLQRLSTRKLLYVMVIASGIVSFGYYFLDQI